MFCFLGSEGRKNIVCVVLVVAITKENGGPVLLRPSFWDVGSQRTWKASTQFLEMLGENITITYLKMCEIAGERVSRAEWRGPLKSWQLASVENGRATGPGDKAEMLWSASHVDTSTHKFWMVAHKVRCGVQIIFAYIKMYFNIKFKYIYFCFTFTVYITHSKHMRCFFYLYHFHF